MARHDVYEALRTAGLTLPVSALSQGGLYTPVQPFGQDLLYCSGAGPRRVDDSPVLGKLGRELSVEQGQAAAHCCALKLLANLQVALGDLNRIRRFVKLLVFVNCTDDFTQQPAVADGASGLLCALFGEEAGLPARSAVGVCSLPGGAACELEALVELFPQSSE